jgi:dTDP-4-amino-4,6-dideoxygalactose transaminase
MIKSIPPVGHPVVFGKEKIPPSSLFPGYRLVWLNSGTQALAYSLMYIKRLKAHIDPPEVIIPGYCCPDLLAAALFAGFKPVVVDINSLDPAYDFEELERAFNSNTCAIIAINFMGLKEQLAELKALAGSNDVFLIEDNAQWFPDLNEADQLQGDFVTFSFGRGKAISLLGGGLVAIRESLPKADVPKPQFTGNSQFKLKSKIFDVLTTPFVYSCLEKVPALKLGATEYHAISGIEAMPVQKQRLFSCNYEAYQKRSRNTEMMLDELFRGINQLSPLLNSQRRGRLLRYPVLLKTKDQRNELYNQLASKGVGVSSMYQVALSEISGVSSHGINFPQLPNANDFAQRFLTFPVHAGVTEKHINTIQRAIKKLR